MTDLHKVTTGAPLRLSAETFNSFIDAARDHRQRLQTLSRTPQREPTFSHRVTVRNASGGDRERFHVLALDTVILTPTDNAEAFLNGPAFEAIVPTAALRERFVILQAPLPAGGIGHGLIGGVSPVQIDVSDETHDTAGAADGIASHLVSGTGAARILWKGSGTGLVWAVVQFPIGGTAVEGTPLKVARITGKAGTAAPYLYTGLEVEHDGSSEFAPENYLEVPGGDDLGWTLINAQEIGDAGLGVAPLPIGAIVGYTPHGSRFLCTASNYRGTY